MLERMLEVSIMFFLILVNVVGFVYFSVVIYNNFRTKREQARRLKKLESNKCQGPHSWINMSVDGSKTHVCRDCYFSPKHDTFVKEFFVKEAVYTEQFDLDYKKYLDEKAEEMVQKYGISKENIIEINNKINELKQEFSLNYFKKIIQELVEDSEKK